MTTATEMAAAVRAGRTDPEDLARSALLLAEQRDGRIGAFQTLDPAGALASAQSVRVHPTRNSLPLAGVPIAIKDNLDVRGLPTRVGSSASSEAPADTDHETVRRLREAGAVIIGKTKVPELCLWAATDGAFGVTRNPWDTTLTPGGSSGGSAAAVASGVVPIALGNDGLGSIRVPAACCGLFGFKPGYGLVPAQMGQNDWYGFVENGPLSATVADGALMLSVLAAKPELAAVAPVERKLRVAISTVSPGFGIFVDPQYRAATEVVGRLLTAAGHSVEAAHPPYSSKLIGILLAHWCAGASLDVEEFDETRLEPRTRRHVKFGRYVRARNWVGPQHRKAFRAAVDQFFARFDVLLTPGLAQPPIRAVEWSRRAWLSNIVANSRYAPFAAPWNLAGFPAATLPAGMHKGGTPLSVQFVSRPGREALLLSLAAYIESRQPWPRTAPQPTL